MTHVVSIEPRSRRCECLASQSAAYFCFTAMAEISSRALLTKAAAWMVARAGLGSGSTLF
jgi:hypothetical protein